MSTSEARTNPKDAVRARQPRADVVFQKPAPTLGERGSAHSEGGWVVLSSPTLGAQALGTGATEDEAWSDAASRLIVDERPSMDFKKWLRAQESADVDHDAMARDLDEWRSDVADLCRQIKGWLVEDDAQKVLKLEEDTTTIHESGLGPYNLVMMRIGLKSRRFVQVIPIARNVVGSIGGFGRTGFRSEGRVDMQSPMGRYMIHRTFTDSGRIWLMVDDDAYRVSAWNKENFEAALLDLLT